MFRIFAFLFALIATSASAQTYPPQIAAINPASLITLTDQASADTLRSDLITKIFGPAGMDTALQPTYFSTYNFAGSTWASVVNLNNIQEWRVTVAGGVVSRLYRFQPTTYRNPTTGKGAMIISAGHGQIGTSPPYTDIIKWLITSGYEVWTVDMPFSGLNGPPYTAYPTINMGGRLGNVLVRNHDEAEALLTPTFNPLRFFLEPPLSIVNNLNSRGITNIAISGLSGGGWTTDVYSALDTRIRASYSVAGSMPIYARSWAPPNPALGDWEQRAIPSLGTDYIDLYILSSIGTGRRHVNLHNLNDDCCFGGTIANHYAAAVGNVVNAIGGSYSVVIDNTAATHTITPWAANWIEQDVATRF